MEKPLFSKLNHNIKVYLFCCHDSTNYTKFSHAAKLSCSFSGFLALSLKGYVCSISVQSIAVTYLYNHCRFDWFFPMKVKQRKGIDHRPRLNVVQWYRLHKAIISDSLCFSLHLQAIISSLSVCKGSYEILKSVGHWRIYYAWSSQLPCIAKVTMVTIKVRH